MGIKVHQYPRIPRKACTFFTLLGNVTVYDFVCDGYMTPKNLTTVTGPWIFCSFTAHFLCHMWSSKACKVFCSRGKSANLHRLALRHQYNEPISQRLGRKTVTGPEPLSYGI